MNEGLITAFSSEFKLSVKLESQAMKIRRTVMSPPDNWKSETMALFRSLIRPRCGHDESSPDDCGLQLNLRLQTHVATCHIHKLKKFQRNSAMKKWHADPYTCSWAQSKPWVRPTSQVAKTAIKSWQTQQAPMACCSDSNHRHSLLKNHLPMVIDEPSNSHNHLTSAFRVLSRLISPWSSSTWTLNCITESAKMLTDQCWRWKISMIRIWNCAVIYSDRLTTDRSGLPELLSQESCLH